MKGMSGGKREFRIGILGDDAHVPAYPKNATRQFDE